MYFYELHEGDDDLFSDILLARETEMSPEEFFETVQEIRRRVKDGFEDDTLIEAIAVELERDHGFVYISDDHLTAAVNVSMQEEENFLADLSAEDEADGADEDGDDGVDDGDDDEGELAVQEREGYRSIYARLTGDAKRPN